MLSGGEVRAQIHPDAKTGHKIADKLCTGCHIVGSKAANNTMPADVPTFEEIANHARSDRAGDCRAHRHPAPADADDPLTREEIGDVAAYILTLRNPSKP